MKEGIPPVKALQVRTLALADDNLFMGITQVAGDCSFGLIGLKAGRGDLLVADVEAGGEV